MNILHANAHSALYLDVRDVLHRLGHRVHSWCVSRHMLTCGHDSPIEAQKALAGWPDINPEFRDRFVARYRSHLASFDAFIVDHPVCFAALFEHTGRPVIANATTRYDASVIGDRGRRAWLDETLRRMHDKGQLIPISNNRGDRAYAQERLGFEWPMVPSLCEYTGAKYSGELPTWLRSSLNVSPLPRPYSWHELGRYAGIATVPYNCSQMSMFEFYASAFPIVVPSQRRLLAMALSDEQEAMAHVSFLRILGQPPGEGLDDYKSSQTLERWIALSDWYDEEWMPGVVTCDGDVDDEFLRSVDARAVSARMAAFIPTRRTRILDRWRALLDGLSSRAA